MTSQTNAATAGSGLDGTGLAARFSLIGGMVFHPVTDNLYVTDEGSHTIRMVTPEGEVTTVAGTGALGKPPTSSIPSVATSVLLNAPTGMAYNHRTNKFYFSDTGNRMVRVFDPVRGTIVRLAGSGSKSGNEGTMKIQTSPPSASFQMPGQLAYFFDPKIGDTVFVLDCLDVDYEPDYPNSDYASPTKVPDQLRRIMVDLDYVDIAAYQTRDDSQMPFSFFRTASGIAVDPSSTNEAVVFFSDQCVYLEVLFPCVAGGALHAWCRRASQRSAHAKLPPDLPFFARRSPPSPCTPCSWNKRIVRWTEAGGALLFYRKESWPLSVDGPNDNRFWPGGLMFDAGLGDTPAVGSPTGTRPVPSLLIACPFTGGTNFSDILRISVPPASSWPRVKAALLYFPFFVADGSFDGIMRADSKDLDGSAFVRPNFLAADRGGGVFLAHRNHNKIMRIATLTGQACNASLAANSPEHPCRPGTWIDWTPPATCKPCGARASRDVFAFSSFCEDENGAFNRGKDPPPSAASDSTAAQAGLATAVGVISAGFVLTVAATVLFLRHRRALEALKRRPSSGEADRGPATTY